MDCPPLGYPHVGCPIIGCPQIVFGGLFPQWTVPFIGPVHPLAMHIGQEPELAAIPSPALFLLQPLAPEWETSGT